MWGLVFEGPINTMPGEIITGHVFPSVSHVGRTGQRVFAIVRAVGTRTRFIRLRGVWTRLAQLGAAGFDAVNKVMKQGFGVSPADAGVSDAGRTPGLTARRGPAAAFHQVAFHHHRQDVIVAGGHIFGWPRRWRLPSGACSLCGCWRG